MSRCAPQSRWIALFAAAACEGVAQAAVVDLQSKSLLVRSWDFFGMFHPVMVHFPIALIAVAAGLELVRARRGDARPASHAVTLLLIGAAAAAVAAGMGWSRATTAGYAPDADTLQVHRWVGVAGAIVAAACAVLSAAARRAPSTRMLAWYRLVLVASAITVGVAGHFGGTLVYGENYFGKAWAALTGRDAVRVAQLQPTSAGSTEAFERDVFPVLSRRCFNCHSGDEPKSGLRLNSREGMIAGGDSGGAVVVPGKSSESLLIKAVRGEDKDLVMPPRGERLTPTEIAAIAAWIDAGAHWPGGKKGDKDAGHWHWAYAAPKRPRLPAAPGPGENAIDAFVGQRLRDAGLAFSAPASREALIRRVSLDLTGLPPTPEEVDAFVADQSPGAYEKVVDRLLASPRYGERWAAVWLDLARYADSHGYEKDGLKVMWPYRDWVIQAYNDDLPFDRFTVDQLAGDLFPDPTLDQLVASGFHRNTQINEEGGTDPEEFRVDAVIDRVNTTAYVWLGATLACAQCHDHKYDPLTQKDYYRFFALFNQDDTDTVIVNSSEKRAAGGMAAVPRREDWSEFQRLRARQKTLTELMGVQTPALARAQEAWEARTLELEGRWTAPRASSLSATNGAKLTQGVDGAILASGDNPDKSTYTLEFVADKPMEISLLRLRTIPSAAMPAKGAGRAGNSNFVLSELSVDVARGSERPARVGFAQAAADWEQPVNTEAFGAALATDGKVDEKGWAIVPRTGEAHRLVVRLAEPLTLAVGDKLSLTMAHEYGAKHTIGSFAVEVSSADARADESALSGSVVEALRAAAADRTPEQRDALLEQFRSVSPELKPMREELASVNGRIQKLTAAQAPVMLKNPEPRVTHLFQRGSFLSPGDEVSAGVPAVLGSLPEGVTADRLALARWLVDPANPLTSRVAVNRLWARLFGHGLVETEEDFGTQGDKPTHPELLDWLACEFPRLGWSQKQLLRLMVTSRTYRQDSRVTPELLEKDPANKLLARGPRHRLEAETIRDNALAASGLLSAKLFGPSVFPPQPSGIWTQIYSGAQWMTSQGEDRFRRGIYTFARRTSPYPTFSGFDAPSREMVCTRRPRTNTPLQALTLLNDPQFVEAAANLAVRTIRAADAPEARLSYAFRRCLARTPARGELDRLARLLDEQLAAFGSDPAAATALAAQCPADHAGVNEQELAAWTTVCNVLLNLDETVTKE